MWERPFVLEDLAEVAAVDPAAASRATDEMFGLVLRLIADTVPLIFAAREIHHVSAEFKASRSWCAM
jgi:hypothetical protein